MWFLKRLVGGSNSNYLDELSDDSSDDSNFDYSLEPRTGKIMSNLVQCSITNTENNFTVDKDVSEVTTDASLRSFPSPELAITLDGVLAMEKNLENYEVVSLVFLLYQDPNYALQELILYIEGAQKNPLYTWAVIEQNNASPWQNKIIEALCIIKNYQVLCSLGYKKNDLFYHHLPHLVTSVTSLNKARKAIYLLCEKLNSEKNEKFLDIVKNDFREKDLPFQLYDSEFLELYFLYWESIKYISMTDLYNIKRAMKVMEEDALYDILESAFQKREERPTTEAVKEMNIEDRSAKEKIRSTDAYQRPSTSREDSGDFQSSPSSIGRDNSPNIENADESHKYYIDPENPGLALIINQEEFYTEFDEQFVHLLPKDIKENKLESRLGTQRDKDDLDKTFSKFGFKVIIAENLTHEELIVKVKEVVKSVRNESSLFVCILSHGDKGIVYGSNSCKVKVSEIQDILSRINKDNLRGKPKILILQSCQGKLCQRLDDDSEEECENLTLTTDGPNISKSSVPRTLDILTFWATVPGYAAIRNKRTGSWFIQALVKKMTDLGNKIHFADICTRIVNDVSNKTWTVREEKNAMVPTVQTTLSKDFYLPPIKSN